MQEFTVYFSYSNVYDLCVVKATTKEDAIAKAQTYFNNSKDYADVTVNVYNAVA